MSGDVTRQEPEARLGMLRDAGRRTGAMVMPIDDAEYAPVTPATSGR